MSGTKKYLSQKCLRKELPLISFPIKFGIKINGYLGKYILFVRRRKKDDFNEAISFLCFHRQNGARLPPVIASLRFRVFVFRKVF